MYQLWWWGEMDVFNTCQMWFFQTKHQRAELSYLVDRPRRVNRWEKTVKGKSPFSKSHKASIYFCIFVPVAFTTQPTRLRTYMFHNIPISHGVYTADTNHVIQYSAKGCHSKISIERLSPIWLVSHNWQICAPIKPWCWFLLHVKCNIQFRN